MKKICFLFVILFGCLIILHISSIPYTKMSTANNREPQPIDRATSETSSRHDLLALGTVGLGAVVAGCAEGQDCDEGSATVMHASLGEFPSSFSVPTFR